MIFKNSKHCFGYYSLFPIFKNKLKKLNKSCFNRNTPYSNISFLYIIIIILFFSLNKLTPNKIRLNVLDLLTILLIFKNNLKFK